MKNVKSDTPLISINPDWIMSPLLILFRGAIPLVLVMLVSCLSASAENKDWLSPQGKRLLEECRLAVDGRCHDRLLEKGIALMRVGKVEGNEAEVILGMCNMLNARIAMHDTLDFTTDIERLKTIHDTGKYSSNMEIAAATAYTLGKYNHFILNAYTNSLQYYLEAFEAHRKSGDGIGAIADLSAIAVINLHLEEPSGWDYALKAYNEAKKLQHSPSIYITAANLGSYLYNEGKYDEALEYLNEADRIAGELHYAMEKAWLYTSLASVSDKMGNPKRAEELFKMALKYEPGTTRYDSVYARIIYATFLKNQNRHADALALLEDSENMMSSYGMRTFLAQLYPLAAECHEALGNYRMALEYQKKSMILTSELLSEEKEREFAILDLRYKVSEEKRRNADLSLDVLRKKRYAELAVVIAMFMLFGGAFLYIYHRKQMSAYKIIVRQHLEQIEAERRIKDKYEKMLAERQEVIQKSTSLSDNKLDDLFVRLEELMINDKIYRQCDLSLEGVAHMLGTNRTYLSQVVNERAESFAAYVNSFRLRDAVSILSDPDNDDSLKSVAVSAGFASVSNFYSLFRKKMGMAPSVFRDNVRNLSHENN